MSDRTLIPIFAVGYTLNLFAAAVWLERSKMLSAVSLAGAIWLAVVLAWRLTK